MIILGIEFSYDVPSLFREKRELINDEFESLSGWEYSSSDFDNLFLEFDGKKRYSMSRCLGNRLG